MLGLGFTEPIGIALAGIPALLNLGLLAFSIRRLPRDRITHTFMFFLSMLLAWQVFDLTVRMAVTVEAAQYYRALLRVWQFLAISSGLHLALLMAEFDRVANHPVTLGLLYVPCLLFESSYTAHLIDEHLEHVPVWGWIADSRDLGPVFAVLSSLFSLEAFLAAVILVWNVWRTRGQGDRHLAARMFAIGICIPVVSGVFLEIGFPILLGLRQWPLTSTTLSAFTLMTALALARYDLFRVNTLAAARAVLETLSDSLLVVHQSGRIRYANPVAEQLFGVREGDAWAALFVEPAERDAFTAGPMARALGGERVTGAETRLRPRSGGHLQVSVSMGPLHTETVGASAVVLVHDVGPLKDTQAELEAARDAAEAANRAKTMFLATTSHELRTPLNAIIGYSELLSEAAEDEGAEDRLVDLRRIERSGRMLLTLIDDLIDLSRVEAGRLTLAPSRFVPADLLREIAPIGMELCRRRANEFVYEEPADPTDAIGDRQRVRQVLFNLLSNAAKFTDRGRIRVWVTHGDQRVRFHVSDTGIGMSAEGLQKLFGLFNQVHEKDHAAYGGAGIGLALSRRLCRMMEGDLTVTSRVGEGSVFTIDLPAAPGAAAD